LETWDWVPSFSLLDASSGSIASADIWQYLLPKGSGPQSIDETSCDTDTWNEQQTTTELYSTVACIYKTQIVGHRQLNTSPEAGVRASNTDSSETLESQAIQLVQMLPEGSAFENTLL
jgi:hypothetical protein